jgi:hypothetical protein
VRRVDPRFGSVGEWYFEHPDPLVAPYGFDDYRRLLELVQSVAEVLEEHKLLCIRLVRLHHAQWEPHDIERSLSEGRNASGIVRTCGALLAEARPGQTGLPTATEIMGDGFVVDPSLGAYRLPDIMSLTATMYGNLAINVATHVDAWMEYGIDATPQPEIHRLNAPRLEEALVEIQRRIQIIPVTEPTRFAVPERTGLRNQVYDDGEPVDCSILLE